ncbi:methyltransferase [Roseiarcaceae bacterium H3SJ34-1]|uniref:tRNA1(Val) (adenine(37)-N6)-methyltransferase n=1 Tax=Terripilifer ovatus TaxID=3032367 RepID=UPI003AB95B7B|nr:methyltransferase [Roseiarcaceae bacterium H3SJ34-1]
MTEADALPDTLLGGRLKLRQPLRGHRAGTDAILLAAAVAGPVKMLADLGAGVGSAGLAAALRLPLQRLELVEKDPSLAELARQNIALNGLDSIAETRVCDVLDAKSRLAAGLANDSFDGVAMNPPWYAAGRNRVSPDPGKASAHAMAGDGDPTVDPWLRAASAILRPGGTLTLIHRPDSLPAILAACEGRLGDVAVLPVHARPQEPATRILLRGIKGSRAPFRLAPPLVLHRDDGRFTETAEAIHRDLAAIVWPQ